MRFLFLFFPLLFLLMLVHLALFDNIFGNSLSSLSHWGEIWSSLVSLKSWHTLELLLGLKSKHTNKHTHINSLTTPPPMSCSVVSGLLSDHTWS